MQSLAYVGVAALLAGFALNASPQGAEQYLKADGTLKETVRLSEKQDGFAGVGVKEYTIETDGSYVFQSYILHVNAKGVEEKRAFSERKSKLTKDDLNKVAAELAGQKFAHLPDKLGGEAKVNARSVTVRVGKKQTILNLKPGDEPNKSAAGDPQAGERTRFSNVARAIRELIDEKPK